MISNRKTKPTNDGRGFERTNVKLKRFLPYSIFIDKKSFRNRYRNLPTGKPNLYDFIVSTLVRGGYTCASLTAGDTSLYSDILIPENVFLTRAGQLSKTVEGKKKDIDLYAVIDTILDQTCSCVNNNPRLYYSEKRAKQLYLPSNFDIKYKNSANYPWSEDPVIPRTDYNPELARVAYDKKNNQGKQFTPERPNKAYSLKQIITDYADSISC
jgi:hypothetical protein